MASAIGEVSVSDASMVAQDCKDGVNDRSDDSFNGNLD